MVTALDELRTLDLRRRDELRAAEEAERQRRSQVEALVRERLEAEEELRRQARSVAEAKAWADAQREVEEARARHAAEDRARIEQIEAAALATATARLAEQRAELDRIADGAGPPRGRRGWTIAAAALGLAVVAVAWWGAQQAQSLAAAHDQRAVAERAASDARARVDELSAELRSTLTQVKALSGKIDELGKHRPTVTPPVTSVKPAPRPRPGGAKPGGTTGTTGATGPDPIKVCTDRPLC